MIGGRTPAGSDEQLVSAGTILAGTRREIFSKRQIAFAFARRRQGRRLILSYWTAPRCSRVLAHCDAARPDAGVEPGYPHHELRFSRRAVVDCSGRRLGDKDLNWQRVIDHVAAEIRIVIVWLDTFVRTFRAGEQRVAAEMCRRNPLVLPAPPRVPVYGIEKVALHPRCATIDADPDLRYIGVPRPCRAENRIAATG